MILGFTLRQQRQRHVRQRRQIGDADRTFARHDGMNTGVEHCEQRIEHRGRNAGAACSHSRKTREHHCAHGIGREAQSDTDGPRAHRAFLVRRELAGRDRQPGVRAERGRQAVDRFVGSGEPVDRRARRAYALARFRAQGNCRSSARDAHDVAQRDAMAFEHGPIHRTGFVRVKDQGVAGGNAVD